jgi:hypothetical protein
MVILDQDFDCHAASQIMPQAVGNDSVRDLVTDFVWMAA